MRALVLELHYLTGRSVATAYNDRERPEWPPHPARVYSALVATWAESEERDERERHALEWLSGLPAPCIYATEASHRAVVPHFVPVNDVAVLDTCDRQRSRLDELRRGLEDAKAKYEEVRRTGSEKQIAAAMKELARSEQAEGAGRKKLEQLLLDDQEPFAAGKHPRSGLASAAALIPEHRGKQPRSFPSVSPEDPRAFLRWSADEDLERHGPALRALVSRVVRVGHSGSLVACRVVDDCPTPTWEPSDDGEEVLRVPGLGQLQRLEEAFARHQEIEPRVLPCRFQRYRRVGQSTAESIGTSHFGDDWIVFRQVGGRRLLQTIGVAGARAMRGALLKHSESPAPELLSGHAENGGPSETPHVAIVPLPFVGHPHATGELLGLALIFPRAADEAQRRAVLRAIGLWEEERRRQLDDELVDTPPLELTLGHAGVVTMERVEWGLAPLKTLRSSTWCHPSRSWVTATPIALDRNPGNLFARDPEKVAAAYEEAERSIAAACERIGLPAPSYVQIHPSVPLVGSTKARAYPPFPDDPSKNQRVKVHARIEFPVRVRGPLLLGAGRYYGLGLCWPLSTEARLDT